MNRKRILMSICALVLASVFALSACSNPLVGVPDREEDLERVSLAMKSDFDMAFFTEWDPAYEQMWVFWNDEHATEGHEKYLQVHLEDFAFFFGLDLTKVSQQNIDALKAQLDETYSHANYRVDIARMDGRDYIVPVTAYPFDAFMRLAEATPELASAWVADCDRQGFFPASAEGMDLWARYLTGALEECTDEGGYLDPVLVEIRCPRTEDDLSNVADYEAEAYAMSLVVYYPEEVESVVIVGS